MPLAKVQFAPGIITETTNYTASGGWFACDKMRFRAGMPEKIGGWNQILGESFLGTCRYIHQWSNVEGNQQYLGLGTSSKLYILWSNSWHDITPIRNTVDLASVPNPVCAIGGDSSLMTV